MAITAHIKQSYLYISNISLFQSMKDGHIWNAEMAYIALLKDLIQPCTLQEVCF